MTHTLPTTPVTDRDRLFTPTTSPSVRVRRVNAGRFSETRRAPGTCGELLQGAIDGRDFMINCPIDRYATAVAQPIASDAVELDGRRQYEKVAETIGLLARRVGGLSGIRVAIDGDIPRGKGMASSTADVAAGVAATLACAGLYRTEQELARLITSIEPSDCTHYRGVADLNFLTGELNERLPAPRDLRVLVVDCGGAVETVAFERERARSVYRRHANLVRDARAALRRGLRGGCNRLVAAAATASAELSQSILPKWAFERLRALSHLGALGINCAHSGTVLGLLYEPSRICGERLRDRLLRTFGDDLPVVGDHLIIAGGIDVV
ncbi:MAG: hypothetical protein QM674_06790 [Burkholderiaceae bacterium]